MTTTDKVDALIHEYGKLKFLQGSCSEAGVPFHDQNEIAKAHEAIVAELVAAEVISEVIADEKLKVELDLWRSAFGHGDPLTVRGDWQRKFMVMEEMITELRALLPVNTRCCQPEYCKANAPEDYLNPDQCKDCDK